MSDKVILFPGMFEYMDEILQDDPSQNELAVFQCPLCLNSHVCTLEAALGAYRYEKGLGHLYFYCQGEYADAFSSIKEARITFGNHKNHSIRKMKEATVVNHKIVRHSIGRG